MADEVRLPVFPCPQKFTFWDTALLPEGHILGRVLRPVRQRTLQGRFPPARLLHPGGFFSLASAVFEIPAGSYPKLDDGGRVLLDLLRESGSRAEKQGCDQHRLFCVHNAFTAFRAGGGVFFVAADFACAVLTPIGRR